MTMTNQPTKPRKKRRKLPKLVDLAGISRHMSVDRKTPQQWKQRGLLPPVDFPYLTEPVWLAETIRDGFALPTKRLWIDNPGTDASPE